MSWRCPHCEDNVPAGDPHSCSEAKLKLEMSVDEQRQTIDAIGELEQFLRGLSDRGYTDLNEVLKDLDTHRGQHG